MTTHAFSCPPPPPPPVSLISFCVSSPSDKIETKIPFPGVPFIFFVDESKQRVRHVVAPGMMQYDAGVIVVLTVVVVVVLVLAVSQLRQNRKQLLVRNDRLV